MNHTAIDNARAYLTVDTWDGRKQIVDIELLLHRHRVEAVLGLLAEMLRDHKKRLRKLILSNRSDPRIDHEAARCFRISMALNTLRNQSRTQRAA